MRNGKNIIGGAGVGLACLLLTSAAFAQEIRKINPPIHSVIVYPDRALVTRSLKVRLSAGKHKLVFQNARPALETASLRAFSENRSFVIQGISSRVERKTGTLDPRVRALEKALEALEKKRSDLLRERERARKDLNGARRYYRYLARTISRRSTQKPEPGTGSGRWTRAHEFLGKRYRQSLADVRGANEKLFLLAEKIRIARARLRKVKDGRGKTRRIVEITLQASARGSGRVGFSYMIRGASWRVSYGMRLRKDGRAAVEYFGNIRQTTGEDWKNIHLSLSTSRPALGAERPRLRPGTVAGVKARTKQVIVNRQEQVKEERKSADKGGSGGGRTGGHASLEDSGASLLFKIRRRANIPSLKRFYRVTIAEFTEKPLDRYFRITASRKKAAYLALRLKNNRSFPLMSGAADIFRGSGFIGRSRMPRVPAGSEYLMGFGLERNIKVRRNVWRSSASSGVFSSGRVYYTRVSLELLNAGDQPRRVSVFETIPVSEIEDIKVLLKGDTTPGYSIKDKTTGILRWNYRLGPGEKKKIILRYGVEVPSKIRRSFYGK